jgi:N4-(beta-N-acetylglucosaminyl)-L-asparaginase
MVTTTPVIVGSERSEAGLPAAMDLLRQGAGALDAVEAALRLCEDNRADHYVGTGGLPNARGEVELDASVMMGSTRAFGAVAAVKGYPHPISIARAVLERLPQHCLLVGAGAEGFAAENGFETAELLTEESRLLFEQALLVATAPAGADGPGREGHPSAAERPAPGALDNELYRTTAIELVKRFRAHDGPWGTINVLALDATGELCVGVSTSGYPWKYPGRVGDSALPGTGNYCDLRYGGAACTGRGEMAMRVSGARQVVDMLAAGREPAEACRAMLADALSLPDPFAGDLRALALTPDGRHGGAATGGGASYAVMTARSPGPEIFPRVSL